VGVSSASIGPNGRYRILQVLGSGGFGVVVCALQTGPMGFRRKVAIKRLHHTSTDHTSIDRRSEDALISEARLGGLIRHKNIVAIYNLEQDEDGWLVVMEYVEGMTLFDLLARCRQAGAPLPTTTVIDIAAQICSGLAHAHSLTDDGGRLLGLVHRDLKPANLMLTSDGLVKIMDFGIARTQRWTDPLEGMIAGTSTYMSPEQSAGSKKLDHRADLYSLGVVLFELLTMRPPPSHPVELREALAGLKPGMRDLLSQALEPDPRDRIASAKAFGAALRAMTQAPNPISIEAVVSSWQPERTEAVPGGIDGNPADVLDSSSSGRRPYRGLRGFDVSDGALFFGRDDESRRLAQRISSEPMVTVTGVSGVGKSSLLRAGVAPLLPDLDFCWCRPGTAPIASLLVALGNDSSRRDELANHPSSIRTLMRPKQVLIIDQAEELFTLTDPSTARVMANILAQVVQEDEARVVLVVREDFFVPLVTLPPLARLAHRVVEVLAPPGRAELHEVLCRPLEDYGYRFEDDALIEEVLDMVENEPAALALLQFCADRLWDDRDTERRCLLRSSYREIGGVSGALAHHAEQVYQTLTQGQRRALRDLMLKLVTHEGTRQPARFRELTETARDAHLTAALLDHLITVRLLNAREGMDGQAIIEVVHEALIERWARLSQWRNNDREGLLLQQNLKQATQTWNQRGRSADLLWRGDMLAEYHLWRQRSQITLTQTQRDFITCSLAQANRGRRRTLIAVGAVLIALTTLLSWALEGWRTAHTTGELALTAQRQAEAHARDAGLQVKLNLAAVEGLRGNTGIATQITRAILTADPNNAQAMEGLYAVVGNRQERHILTGHTAAVRGVQYSADGRFLLSVSMDQTARLYRPDGTFLTDLRGHEGLLNSGHFSPDSSLIVTASRDQTARIWSLDGETIAILDHDAEVMTAKWSPDGSHIITTSTDASAKVWGSDGQLLHILPSDSWVGDATWSQDGKTVFTLTSTSIRSWSLTDGSLPWSAEVNGANNTLQLSPSGRYLLAFGWNGARDVRTTDGQLLHEAECETRYPFGSWHPTEDLVLGCVPNDPHTVALIDPQGNEIMSLPGHPEAIFGAHYSPSGHHIAVIGKEGAVSLWTGDGSLVRHYEGHRKEVVSAAWSPSGRWLATGSDDNTIRIWSGNGTTPGTTDLEWPISVMAWSPDGSHLLAASWNGVDTGHIVIRDAQGHVETAPIDIGDPHRAKWNPRGDRFAILTRRGRVGLWSATGTFHGILEGENIENIDWHPGGDLLLGAAGEDGFLRWDREGTPLPTIEGQGRLVTWSPDGHHWVSHDGDNTLSIWTGDSSPRELARLDQARVLCICWRGDSERFAATSHDGTVAIWDSAGEPMARNQVSSARVTDCAWSPNGELLAMASWDRQAIIWRADGSPVAILKGHSRAVQSVEWSPDGEQLISAAWDTTARVWSRKGALLWGLHKLHDGEQIRASWSADGSWLATSAKGDSRLRVLPATPERLLEHARQLVPSSRSQE